MINKAASTLVAFLYGFSALIVAFFIAWIVMFKVDFFYPSFYELLSIDQTILEFAPQNYYKKGFELTDKAQHISIFSDIVTAIHNDGIGLKQISYSYQNDDNQNITSTFLHQAEVIHLQDVADLLNLLTKFALAAMFIWCVLAFSFIYQKKPLPSFKSQLISMLFFIGTTSLVVLIVGPKKVFYWLHTVVFPADNQWFFYYQDSLMTTMMKAPILFAPISIVLVVLAVCVFILMKLMIQKVGGRFSSFFICKRGL